MDFNKFRKNNESLAIDLKHRALAAQEVQELLEYLGVHPQITYLIIKNSKITDELINVIANSRQLQNITALDLSLNQIGAAAATAIANSKQLKNLTALDLSLNQIGAAAATAIANSKQLKNLTSLNLSLNRIGDAGAKDIANSEQLKNLTSLNLAGNQIGDAGAKDIANSKQLKNLTFLNLSENHIGDAGAKDIAKSKQLQNLTALNLAGNQIGAAGATAIANSEQLKNLTSLNLAGNQIGDAGAKDIANSKQLQNITSLNLSGNQIGVAGATAIANSEQLKNLTSLNLARNQIGAAGAKDIAKSKQLQNLTSLNLAGNKIEAVGATAIANSEQLKNLTSLNLAGNQIGAAGATAIAKSKQLKNLTSLTLFWNQIGTAGATAIAKSKQLQNLTYLNLSENDIGAAGATAIAKSKQLKNLTSLNLSGNQIGAAGATAIAKSKQLQNLTSLNLSENQIGAAGVELLFESLINTSVVFEGERGRFYNNLVIIKDTRNSGNDIAVVVKDMIFNIAQVGNEDIVQYIIHNSDKYPFLINTVLINTENYGVRLDIFYTHNPEMQKFLFDHGLVPQKEEERGVIQNIARDHQSVHDKKIVNKTNFITSELVNKLDSENSSVTYVLHEKAEDYNQLLPKLFEDQAGKLNPITIKVLDLTEADKKSVMEKVLSNNESVPNDEEFVRLVKEKTIKILQDKYLCKNPQGQYTGGYSTALMQYDWTQGAEQKITIPESIGLIESLINQTDIPRKDKQELCVTLLCKNTGLIESKLSVIKSILQKDDITIQELQQPASVHKLLNEVSKVGLDKLFKDVSDLDITDIWREQQQFKLAKQLYIASTAYGDNAAACIQGTWSQIITTAEEIKPELLNKFAVHVEELKRKEELKDEVNEHNITPLVDQMLATFTKDKAIINGSPELKDGFLDLLLNMIDVSSPKEITLEQQKALAEVNQVFTQHIKEHLPNYDRVVPTFKDYQTFIEALANSTQAERLVNILTAPAIPQELLADLQGVTLVPTSSAPAASLLSHANELDQDLHHHNLDLLGDNEI